MLDTFVDAIIDVVVEFSTGTTCTSVVVVVVAVVVCITLPQDIIISSVCIWW